MGSDNGKAPSRVVRVPLLLLLLGVLSFWCLDVSYRATERLLPLEAKAIYDHDHHRSSSSSRTPALWTSYLEGISRRNSTSTFALTIVVTGDLHGHHLHGHHAALLSTLLRKLREQTADDEFLVVLDAGDATFPGNETLVAHAMNHLGYDAMVVGNHEFDVGPERLRNFINLLHFPVLASNVDGFPSHLRLPLAPNVTLCVIGATANEPNPLAGPRLRIHPELDSIHNLLSHISSSCTRTILLSHAGIALDHQFARDLPTVDVVLGGHSHVLTPLATPPESPEDGVVVEGGHTKLLHTGANGRYIGLVRMEWNHSSKDNVKTQTEVLQLDHIVEPDPDWQQAQQEMDQPSSHKQIHFSMQGTRICSQPCRTGDCLLGNVVADAMRACLEHGPCQRAPGDTTIALLESGTLRNCLLQTHHDLSHVLPWPNQLVLLRLRASTIRKMIQYGITVPNGGAFLQVSGLEYRYGNGTVPEVTLSNKDDEAVSHPPGRGRRQFRFMERSGSTKSCQVSAAHKRLSDQCLYWVVVTDWLASGGDGFAPLVAEAEAVIYTNVSLHDAIWNYASSSAPPFRPTYRSSQATLSSAARSGIAGFFGGGAAFLLTFPIYSLFVRKSMAKPIVRSRLMDGIFLGTLATAISDSIYFMVYAWLSPFSSFGRSTVAAFSNSVATTPLWVMVTHKQLSATTIPIWQVARAVYRDKGWGGFFDSISLNLLMCIYPVVRQLSLETLANVFLLKGSTQVAVAATMASLVATVVTYPIQKWRILLQSGERAPNVQGLHHLFCDGLGFKLLDTCLKTFILFLVKEQSDVMLCILEG